MGREFWVVGGTFRDMSFASLDREHGELHGPYRTYGEAARRWRDLSNQKRFVATARYSIVVTANGLSGDIGDVRAGDIA
jgi:hypothetical protein